MIPSTTERVSLNTTDKMNQAINEKIRDNVARYASATPAMIDERIRYLDHEWDVERVTETSMAVLTIGGVLLAASLGQGWWVAPLVVAGFQFLHAVIGWSPLLPLIRAGGVRTACEIAHERYALKLLRGDFKQLALVTTPQEREDLSRFEGEGGACCEPEPADAAHAEVVSEALDAVKR